MLKFLIGMLCGVALCKLPEARRWYYKAKYEVTAPHRLKIEIPALSTTIDVKEPTPDELAKVLQRF